MLDNFIIKKTLGRGMYGTVYLINYKKKDCALKIEHILKKDMENKKSKVWNEIYFSKKFANKYPDQFTSLISFDFLDNCTHKQEYVWNLNMFDKKLQDELIKLSKSKYCVRKIYSLIDYTLGDIINKLSKDQIYSMIIQFFYIIYILEKNKYIHGDIHQFNIGVVKTDKKYIKIFNKKIPTFGFIYKMIDFGRVLHKKNIKSRSEKKTFENLYYKEADFILTTLISNFPFLKYIKKNKLDVNEFEVRKKFYGSPEDKIISEFCINLDDKCRNYKFNLYKVLFPESYQQNMLGDKFEKVINPIFRIDLIDILFLLKINFNIIKSINYFIYKIII